MATQIRGEPGRIVWMPAGDTEKEVRASKNPNGPFVAVSRNGELLPEVKEIIAIVAKHGLVVASGHILPEDALMVFREAKRQGVQHMIATHAFDLAGKMTIAQMQEAAKLGAFIEFDFRNTLEGGRMEAIRAGRTAILFPVGILDQGRSAHGSMVGSRASAPSRRRCGRTGSPIGNSTFCLRRTPPRRWGCRHKSAGLPSDASSASAMPRRHRSRRRSLLRIGPQLTRPWTYNNFEQRFRIVRQRRSAMLIGL